MKYLSRVVLFVSLTTCLVFGLFAQSRGGDLEAVVGPNVTVGKQWAVFIAIDRYQEWGPLNNPVRDAKEIRDILRESYIIDEIRELYDREATNTGIRRLLTGLQSAVGKDDSVFIFYAGHGYTDSNTNTGFWIPTDGQHQDIGQANWLPNIQIRNMLTMLPARHVFLVSDSCFSGDILDIFRGAPPTIDNDRYRRAYSMASRKVMTSGASEEVPDTSEFILRLKNGLRWANGACIDPDYLYYNAGVRDVQSTLPLLGTISGSGFQTGGSFLFFRKQATPGSSRGSITVNSDIAGEVLIDGLVRGVVKEIGTITITEIHTGMTDVAVREANGNITQAPRVMVQQGQTVSVVIERPVPEGLEYEEVDGRSITITKYSGTAATVHISARIRGLPVTSIGDSAFSYCSNLSSVTIPSSVTSIGNYAFDGCSSLPSITIPSSVTSIGDSAFSSCSSLTNITIPSSVTSIGDWAFFGCSNLTSITIPSSVTSIGYWAFFGCSNLTSVTLSRRTQVGGSAFPEHTRIIYRD